MEATISLETKYQNLASEYSKLRANATVLKKAVLDEQARSKDLKDQLKEHEQRLRKSTQEMESLNFRNQQLTKRISVLQDELNAKHSTRRIRGKSVENNTITPTNVTLLDEELQKKIIDNAQLISTMADKDFEIINLQDRLHDIELKLEEEIKRRTDLELSHKLELKQLKSVHLQKMKVRENNAILSADTLKQNGDAQSDRGSVASDDTQAQINAAKLLDLELEKERWKMECGILRSAKGQDEEVEEGEEKELKEYFYERINELVSEKQEAQSLADSLAAECNALQVRLELCLEEKLETETQMLSVRKTLDRLQEELNTTSHNYEQQLSTMSEHLADLNDKYTEQCELIQQLEYKLGIKGKKK